MVRTQAYQGIGPPINNEHIPEPRVDVDTLPKEHAFGRRPEPTKTPAVFASGTRKIVDTCSRNGNANSLAHLGIAGFATDGGHYPYDECKKRFPEPRSLHYNWKPCKKTYEKVPGQDGLPRPEGLKFLDPQIEEVTIRCEKRHIIQRQCPQEMSDLPQGQKIAYCTEPGREHIRRRDKQAIEVPLEDAMAKKKRYGSINEVRNGIGRVKEGDKLYGHPEYSPGFFRHSVAEGGLIPGSTFMRGDFPKAEVRGKPDVSGFEAEFPKAAMRKSYETLQAERIHGNTVAEVEDLKKWEREVLPECSNSQWQDMSSDEEGA